MLSDAEYEKLKDAVAGILTAHQDAVSEAGAKKVFAVLRKGRSTGYNEMNPAFAIGQIEYYQDPAADRPAQHPKLDIVDFMLGMFLTGDTTPLILMNTFFNIISYKMPVLELDGAGLAELLQSVSKEFFEANNEALERLKDGKFCPKDAQALGKESMDLVQTASMLKLFCDERIKQGGMS